MGCSEFCCHAFVYWPFALRFLIGRHSPEFLLEALFGNALYLVKVQGAQVVSSNGVELCTAQCVPCGIQVLRDYGLCLKNKEAFTHENTQAL